MSVLLKRWDGSSWVDTEINVWSNITGKPSTYTPTAHTHSATDITSGVLAVAKGGTGNSSVDTTPTSGSTKMVTSGGVYSALNKKVDDFQLTLSWNTSGGIIPIKFITVNYTSAGSEAGVFISLKMRGGHGNGTSYVFLQDTFINVGYTGTVVCNNYKHFGILNSSVSFDGSYRRYGDIFWVQDTTNKVVDFYVFVGQYSAAACVMTPYQRMNTSTGGVVTQYTGAGVQFSSGTKVYADNGLYVKSDSVSGDVSATSFTENGTALSSKYSPLAGSSSITKLGTIASGSIPYSLITGTPTIPTKTSDLTNDSGYLVSSGNIATASFLKPTQGTYAVPTWTAGVPSGSKIVWGQSFAHSDLGADTGDILFGLTADTPAGSGNTTALNVGIDGYYYQALGKQVVDLSSAQALTNKTYNGYTLGALCELTDTDDISLGSGAGNACQSYDTLNDLLSSLYNHTQNASNPHGVTASQIGALPLSAGTSNPITGHLMLNGGSSNSSTGTTSQIVMARGTTQQWALSSNDGVFIINPSTSSTTNQFCYYFNTGNIVVPKVNGYTLANGCSLAYSYSSGTLTIT